MRTVLHTGLIIVDRMGKPNGMQILYQGSPTNFIFDIKSYWDGIYYYPDLAVGAKCMRLFKDNFKKWLTKKVSNKAYMKAYYALNNT